MKLTLERFSALRTLSWATETEDW